MNEIKNLLSKVWSKESADFAVGRHEFDEVLVVRVRGSVEKFTDQLVSPTVSFPPVTPLTRRLPHFQSNNATSRSSRWIRCCEAPRHRSHREVATGDLFCRS